MKDIHWNITVDGEHNLALFVKTKHKYCWITLRKLSGFCRLKYRGFREVGWYYRGLMM